MGEAQPLCLRASVVKSSDIDDATLVFTDDKGSLELIRLSQLESIHLNKAPAA